MNLHPMNYARAADSGTASVMTVLTHTVMTLSIAMNADEDVPAPMSLHYCFAQCSDVGVCSLGRRPGQSFMRDQELPMHNVSDLNGTDVDQGKSRVQYSLAPASSQKIPERN